MTIRLHSAGGLRPSTKHLTEGGLANEQLFMLTGDRSNLEQPTVYEVNDWEVQQQNLIEWSNTQRNYGQQGQTPGNCGQHQYDQP